MVVAYKEIYLHSAGTIPACKKDTVNTNDRYHYDNTDLDLSQADGVVFKVRACNDAHVALSSSTNLDRDMYEIVIGGWSNSKSVIR